MKNAEAHHFVPDRSAVVPAPLPDSTVRMRRHPAAVSFAVDVLALVNCAVRPGLHPAAVLFAVHELSFLPRAVRTLLEAGIPQMKRGFQRADLPSRVL